MRGWSGLCGLDQWLASRRELGRLVGLPAKQSLGARCLSSGHEHGEGAMQAHVRVALSVHQEGWWACWQGSQLLGLPMGYAFWACFVELLETGHAPWAEN